MLPLFLTIASIRWSCPVANLTNEFWAVWTVETCVMPKIADTISSAVPIPLFSPLTGLSCLFVPPPNLPYINNQQPHYLPCTIITPTWRRAVAAVSKIRDKIPLSWRSLLFSIILLRMPIYSIIRNPTNITLRWSDLISFSNAWRYSFFMRYHERREQQR